MALSRLHTKRVSENRIIDQQHQGEVINLTVQALETYRKIPASYLCRWTGMPRAKAGGPCIARMPLAITIRTMISDSSRQVGLYLVIMHFIRSTSWKAKQGTAGSSSA